jgi:hypothetical protein
MKIKQKVSFFSTVIFVGAVLAGCASTSNKAFRTEESQVELRNMQTRAFDTTDRKMMMQTIVSTMQDLDFVIDKADATLGTITGTKFSKSAYITMSVTVRPRGETQLMVRANAQYGTAVVKDAETYQDFFNSLGKSLFLTAHQVD